MATLLFALFMLMSRASSQDVGPLDIQKFQRPRDTRILSFGTNMTYGVGLLRPRKYAYPTLLGADNAASAEGNLAVAAACTMTMLQNDEYDAITIEFQTLDSAVETLIARLRKRFPNAKIVLLQTWTPHMIVNKDGISLMEYGEQMGLPLSKELYLHLKAEDNWGFPASDTHTLNSIRRKYSVDFHLDLPKPQSQDFEFPQTLEDTLKIFDNEGSLTREGHELIARSVQGVLSRYPNKERVLGSWGDGDKCEFWYSSGTTNQQKRSLRSFVEFGDDGVQHKHALEMGANGGSIEVENPFQEDRMVYVTYMTSADEKDERVYPKMKVTVAETGTGVIVDPFHEQDNESFQYTRTTGIGLVPPGKSQLLFKPLEKSENNFRLAGISFLGKESETLSLEFALESAPVTINKRKWW